MEKLIDDLADGRKVKPGPQIDRHLAAPQGGPTTLTDPGLYRGHRSFTRLEAPPPAPVAIAAAAPPAPPAVIIPPGTASPAAMAPKPADNRPVSAAARLADSQQALAEKKEETSTAPGKPVTEKAEAETGITPVSRDAVIKSMTPSPVKPPSVAPEPVRIAEPKAQPARQPSPDGKPELLKKPKGGKADDLKFIWGIGPKLELILNAMGIWHFEQIAAWGPRELTWVDEHLEGFKGRARRDEWVKQAKKLAKGWRPDNATGDKPGNK